MSCRKFRKQIFLYRTGELSPRQRKQLERHLAVCANCAAFQRKVKSDLAVLEKLRKEHIQVPDEAGMTNALLAEISRMQKIKSFAGAQSWLERIIPRFYWPTVRLALAACVFLIVGGFVLQEAYILNRISRLEENYKQQQNGLFAPSNDSSGQDANRFWIAMEQVASVQGDKILVDKKALQEVLNSCKELQFSNKLLISYLCEKVPGLDASRIDELESALQKNKKLIRYIRQL